MMMSIKQRSQPRMICAKCNLHYPEHLNFCRRCGNPLIDSTDEPVVEALCCTRCGGRFIHGENFCQQCGYRLSQRSQETVVGGCYGCGTSWRSGWLYCRTCGLDRDQALMGAVSASAGGVSSSAPRIEVEVEEIEKIPCPSCGETIKPYSRFCEVCGGSISPFSRPMSAAFQADLTGLVPDQEPLTDELRTEGSFIQESDDGDILELGVEPTFSVEKTPGAPFVSRAAKTESVPSVSESVSHYGVGPRVRSRITESTQLVADSPPLQSAVSTPKRAMPKSTIVEGKRSKLDPSGTARLKKTKVRSGAAWQTFGIVTVVIIILVLIASWWMMRGTGNDLTKPLNGDAGGGTSAPLVSGGAESIPQATDKEMELTIPEGMVLVPGGIFRMGREGGQEAERPAHDVRVESFFIDRTEVTNEQYLRYIRATGAKPPSHWSGAMYPTGRSQFPVVNVSWEAAKAFAEWAGKRLPSEAEWEFAARGTDGRIYPWGNEWNSLNSNSGPASSSGSDAGLVRVGSFPGGVSPFGLVDMSGNAWEWTNDKLTSYGDGARQLEEGRVIRGGAYDTSPDHSTATYRGVVPEENGYDKTGFRCVRSLQNGQNGATSQ